MSSKANNQSNTYSKGQKIIVVQLLAVPMDSKFFPHLPSKNK